MGREAVKAWLLDYAWLGTPEEQAAEVECILAQGEWDLIETQADRFAGAQAEPGPEAYAEGIGFALSALYECHDGPHTDGCPRRE